MFSFLQVSGVVGYASLILMLHFFLFHFFLQESVWQKAHHQYFAFKFCTSNSFFLYSCAECVSSYAVRHFGDGGGFLQRDFTSFYVCLLHLSILVHNWKQRNSLLHRWLCFFFHLSLAICIKERKKSHQRFGNFEEGVTSSNNYYDNWRRYGEVFNKSWLISQQPSFVE